MIEFVQVAFFGGLAALAVPIVIHLFFRLRTKQVDLGTLRFIRVVLEETARRRRVLRWLLLALRLSAVALLCLLFARPFFPETALSTANAPLLVLIDQSASMQAPGEQGRLIDMALRDARQLLAGRPAGQTIHLATFDHQVHPLTPGEGHTAAVATDRLKQFSPPAVLTGATDFDRALDWCRDRLPTGEEQPLVAVLHVYTDLQRSGINWLAGEALPPNVRVRIHDLSRTVIDNLGIIDFRPTRNWQRPGTETSCQLSILNTGSSRMTEIPLLIECGRLPDEAAFSESGSTGQTAAAMRDPASEFSRLTDRQTLRQKCTLEGGAVSAISVTLPGLEAGMWLVRVTLEYDDPLPIDNRRYCALSVAPPSRVLVLNGRPTTGLRDPYYRETYYLETALRLTANAPDGALRNAVNAGTPSTANTTATTAAAGANNAAPSTEPVFAVETHDVQAGEPLPKLDRVDCVVLADVVDLDAGATQQLAQYVQRGGGLLLFSGDHSTAEATRDLQQAGLIPGSFGARQTTLTTPWRIDHWETSHPMFQPFNDPQHGDLRRLIFAAYTRFNPAAPAKTLATINGGQPFLVEAAVGQGRVLCCTTSCGRNWSDWATSRLFVPMVHQWVGYLCGYPEDRVRLRTIGNDAGELLAGAINTAESLTPAGPGIAIGPRHVDVWNLTARESDTDSCTAQEFAEHYGLVIDDAQQVSAGTHSNSDSQLLAAEVRQNEFAATIAALLLLIWLLEGFVANRSTA